MKYLLLIITLFFISCSTRKQINKQTKPVVWGCDSIKAKQKLVDFSTKKKEPHPLDIGRYLFYTTLKFQETKDLNYKKLSIGYLDLVNSLYNDSTYFNNNSFKYNFAHDGLKPGWWSGMANSAILLGLTYADEVHKTNNDKIIQSLVKNLSTDYRQGGSLETSNEETNWILEYAWEGMNEKSIKSVLNGFVFSLVCLKTADQISSNSELNMLFEKGRKALEVKSDSFYFEKLNWTKYDLVPTIESLHYAIFDLMLLESLNEFSNTDLNWLEKNIERRRDIIKSCYQIELLSKAEGNFMALFSLIGAPHPYWIDIYPIEIEIIYSNGKSKVVKSNPPKKFDIDIVERGFVEFNLTAEEFEEIVELTVKSVYAGEKQELFRYSKDELNVLNKEELELKELEIKKINASFDAMLDSTSISIDTDRKFDSIKNTYKNNIAQILMTFSENQGLKEHQNLVFKIENTMDIEAHKFFIYTEEGNVYERYYLPIYKGKNLIVINPVGFLSFNINEKIKMISWRIYTSKMESKGKIKIKEVYKTDNNYQLRELLGQKGYTFEEKKAKGNIY